MLEASVVLQVNGVRARKGKYSVNGILRRVFSSAMRRETLGKRLKGGRRSGEPIWHTQQIRYEPESITEHWVQNKGSAQE